MTRQLERTLRLLERHTYLADADRAALHRLPVERVSFRPGAYLVREGYAATACTFLLDGFAYRQKLAAGGQRQILSVHLPGEAVDLQHAFIGIADHNVQAMTQVEVATVPAAALVRTHERHPALARGMWMETLIESAIFREWVINIGRRDALTRVAHLLCELALRIRSAGLGQDHRYTLPTQEHLADCVGLTAVHVNRVLRQLDERGLIERERRSFVIRDWDGLRRAGDFNGRYLHGAGETVSRGARLGHASPTASAANMVH